jgi:hypothetical protein
MQIDLIPWLVPNFVRLKMPAVKRQDGFSETPGLPLSEVDADSLSAQCDKFRKEVFKKAGKDDPKA